MRNIQKLEIGVGVISSLVVSLVFFLFVIFVYSLKPTPSDANPFAIIFLLAWICSLIVAVAAYYDVAKCNNITLAVVCIGGSAVTIIFVFFALIVSMMGVSLLSLIAISPSILSVVTIILAISSRMKMPF